ncbi:MAG: hydroxymethylglutaryl-CoA lyase, partial [Acidimicrobiia bacterium]|nr:hydroxymethylglutaryl-CoA lyase [Acidimicrobiia bacterium]
MTTPNAASVEIREVGPRDGLQNEVPVPVADRVRLIDALSRTGLRVIEAAAFVHPAAIPSMAGSEQVVAAMSRAEGVTYRALVPNERGAERAVEAAVDEIEVVVSASDTHSRKNVRMSTTDALEQLAGVIAIGHDAGLPVEGIVATAFGCPYEGPIEPARVAALAAGLLDDGADSLSFGDTTGMATPRQVDALLDALAAQGIAAHTVALHFHNTRNTGLVNIVAALDRGVRRFDASIGGLGGCPYAPGASGNVPTEDVVHLVEAIGFETGIDLEALIDVAKLAEEIVGRELPGQV